MNFSSCTFFSLFYLISINTMAHPLMIDLVKIDKSSRKMFLIQEDKIVKQYNIALSSIPYGHKEQKGDKRTPEGSYTLDSINEQSNYYRAIHINYPNNTDIAQAKTRGVSPGGQIMIHGQKNGKSPYPSYKRKEDWTNGCIAISNQEIDEFLHLVKIGTPINIQW